MTAEILDFPHPENMPPERNPFAWALGCVLALDQLDEKTRGHVMAVWAETGYISTTEFVMLQQFYFTRDVHAQNRWWNKLRHKAKRVKQAFW